MKIHHKKSHGESIAGVEVVCDNCGEVTTKSKTRYEEMDHYYCGEECFEEHIKMRGENGELQEPDWIDPMYGDENPAWKGGDVSTECDTCGKTVERPPSEINKYENNFCSPDCRVEWMETEMAGEKHPQWKGGHAQYYGANWLRQRRKALKRDHHTCQRCKKEESELPRSLEVHHLKRIEWFKKRYDKPEWYERGNDLDNLISLCRSCHNDWEGIPLRPESK
jgi:5-methylcytosine-specific restriction endonuclease McrA